jgi:hypothetical protein
VEVEALQLISAGNDFHPEVTVELWSSSDWPPDSADADINETVRIDFVSTTLHVREILGEIQSDTLHIEPGSYTVNVLCYGREEAKYYQLIQEEDFDEIDIGDPVEKWLIRMCRSA